MPARATSRRSFLGGLAVGGIGTPLGLIGCRRRAEQPGASGATGPIAEIRTRDLGALGTGSNMFRCGVVHSSGAVFIGTYGPPPGIIWKYDPQRQELTKVAAPGEYQLDCMVEAPNGRIYIGTAYSGIVYELNPATGEVRNLGAPPVESTPWIFALTRTRGGEILGARGVGLFRLDWRSGRMESLGVVPGEHETPGVSSNPIVRNLQGRPDGLIWGDTNRWLFTLDPKDGRITPIVDVAAYDEACYGIMHSCDHSPFDDLYFAIYPRFNNRTPRHTLMVCRAATGKLEPLGLPDSKGICIAQGWWRGPDGKGDPRWLVSEYEPQTQRSSVAVIDVLRPRVEDRWQVKGNDTPPTRALDLAGPGVWFYTGTRGGVFRADPRARLLRRVAMNPMPVECRCLAAAPDGRLGTDTYDCGFVFTFDPQTGRSVDHGRPYFDDHRCNWGPAAFAGSGAKLQFISNHGENEQTVKTWVTDLATNRHWAISDPAVQLVRMGDGSVCGTLGRNPPSIDFDEKTCWTPTWIARGGQAFRYVPGGEKAERLSTWGTVGPIAPMPGASERAIVATGRALRVYDLSGGPALQEVTADAPIVALAADPQRPFIYAAIAGERVVRYTIRSGRLADPRIAPFGVVSRGFFVLPQRGQVVGIASDGTVTVLQRGAAECEQVSGPPPLPAGPAVHPTRDVWYFAHRAGAEYWIQ